MEKILILGNVIGLIGSIFAVAACNSKKPKNLVKLQIAQLGFLGVANLILGSFTGFCSSIISIGRNVLCMKNKMNAIIKSGIIACFVFCGIFLNNSGIVGWIPSIASIFITLGLDMKNAKAFRAMILISCLLFMVFDFCIQNYVTCCFDMFSSIAAARQLVILFKKNEMTKEQSLMKVA